MRKFDLIAIGLALFFLIPAINAGGITFLVILALEVAIYGSLRVLIRHVHCVSHRRRSMPVGDSSPEHDTMLREFMHQAEQQSGLSTPADRSNLGLDLAWRDSARLH